MKDHYAARPAPRPRLVWPPAAHPAEARPAAVRDAGRGRVTEGRGSPHGWRATFCSWCADTGVPREVAESALAHTLGGVEAAYNRAAMVERRRPAMQAWADHLTGETESNVTAFGESRA
jgi:integrase